MIRVLALAWVAIVLFVGAAAPASAEMSQFGTDSIGCGHLWAVSPAAEFAHSDVVAQACASSSRQRVLVIVVLAGLGILGAVLAHRFRMEPVVSSSRVTESEESRGDPLLTLVAHGAPLVGLVLVLPLALQFALRDNDRARLVAARAFDVQLLLTVAFSLDALERRKSSTITGQPTQTRHYGDDSDNPAWVTNTDGMLTRMTASLDGLGAMVLGDGTAALALGNPHGDNVTTVVLAPAQPETQDAVSITGWIDYDEYGRSKTGAETGIGYGWLGKHERSTSIESAGLTLMGVRLYNPVRGAFTTTDPVHGGNTTAYTYPQDPVNKVDLTGQFSVRKYAENKIKGLKKLLRKGWNM